MGVGRKMGEEGGGGGEERAKQSREEMGSARGRGARLVDCAGEMNV